MYNRTLEILFSGHCQLHPVACKLPRKKVGAQLEPSQGHPGRFKGRNIDRSVSALVLMGSNATAAVI